MGNLISRQAAIDTCMRDDAHTGYDAACLIAQLPSAQPEIIMCKDCGCWEIDPVCSAYPNLHFCRNWMQRIATEGEDFCSRAERRQE